MNLQQLKTVVPAVVSMLEVYACLLSSCLLAADHMELLPIGMYQACICTVVALVLLHPVVLIVVCVQVLSVLVEHYQADIRACINTLQLLTQQRKTSSGRCHISKSHIAAISSAYKDTTQSVIGLLQQLLRVSPAGSLVIKLQRRGDDSDRLQQLHDAIMDFGGNDLVSADATQLHPAGVGLLVF